MSLEKDNGKFEIFSNETNNELTKNRKMLPKRILKLHDAIRESLELNDLNIADKSMIAPQIIHGWLTTLYSEQALLDKLEIKKDTVKEAWIKKHGENDGPRYISGQIAENECPELQKLNELIKEQREIVRYLTESVKVMKDLQWNIKNAVNIMQMEN
jgi:hypothetical protein